MKMPAERDIIRAKAMLMFTNTPAVFYLFCDETKGDSKYKYLVILSKNENTAHFLMINSKSYSLGGVEIKVTPEELPCLSRVSYIDCRELFTIIAEELTMRVADNIDSFNRGDLPETVKIRMADAVRIAKTLSNREKKIILDALL